jgi:hypothetical protein
VRACGVSSVVEFVVVQATVTERWRMTVPADWTDEQVEEAFSSHADGLDLQFIDEGDVRDERERTVVEITWPTNTV